MSNSVEVKFGGDIAELRRAVQEATAAVRSSMDTMQADMKRATANASSFGSGFSDMAGKVKTAIAGIVTGALIKETVNLADAYTRAESRLKLFVDGQEAQKQVSRELYDISQQTRSGYLENLDLFSRLAQALKGTNTTQRELVTLTETLNKAFAISGASTASRTAATIQLSQALASGVLRGDEFNSVMENGGRIVQILTDYTGKTVGQLRKMAEQGELTAGVVRNALAAGASKVNEEFAKMQPTVAEAGTTLKNTLGGLVKDANEGSGATKGLAGKIIDLSQTIDAHREDILSLFTAIVDTAKRAVEIVLSLQNSIKGFAAVAAGALDMSDFARMNSAEFKQWVKDYDSGLYQIRKQVKDAAAEVKKYAEEDPFFVDEGKYRSAQLRYESLVTEMHRIEEAASSASQATSNVITITPSGVKKPVKADESGGKPTKTKSGAGSDTRLQEWKTELEDMHEAEQDFFKTSLDEDEKYWQSKLATIQGNGKHEQTLRRQIEHELYQIHKQQAQQTRQLDEEEIAAKRQRGLDEVEMARENIAIKQQLGMINAKEAIQLETQLADQTYQVELQALQSKLELYQMDAVAKARTLEQIAQLERKHALDVQKLNDRMLIEQKATIAQWLSPVQSAISTSIQGLIQGTTTLKKAMSNLFTSILASFVDLMVKMAVEWGVQKLAQTTGIASTLLAKKAEVAAVVPAEASMAAGGAAASVASIPIVGPAMAASAYASTMAMVMSGLATGMSGFAVGSWNVPGDMFTKIHKGEMIVPEQFAQNVRDGGGLGGGGTVNLHVHAVDASSVRRLFRDNGAALAETLRRQARNFTPLKV